jgi:hypothetical protein
MGIGEGIEANCSTAAAIWPCVLATVETVSVIASIAAVAS